MTTSANRRAEEVVEGLNRINADLAGLVVDLERSSGLTPDLPSRIRKLAESLDWSVGKLDALASEGVPIPPKQRRVLHTNIASLRSALERAVENV